MEIYLTDEDFNKLDVIDQYQTFIWTERWQTFGDFTLVIAEEDASNASYPAGFYITHSETLSYMTIETVTKEFDADDAPIITIKGRTLLATFFENRTIPPDWVLTGNAGAIIYSMVQTVCVDGTGISPYDVIPGLFVSNNSVSTDTFQVTTKLQDLYSAIVAVAASGGVGFTFTRQFGGLTFSIEDAHENDDVVFSTDLDTLTNVSYLTSIQKYKNIAYVMHKDKTISVVNLPGTDINIPGVDRRTIAVDASDIDPADYPVIADYFASIIQRGIDALNANVYTMAIDGDASDSQYTYHTDFGLGTIVRFQGDVLRFRNDPNQYQQVQVTEYIWASDATGDTNYPTLTALNET